MLAKCINRNFFTNFGRLSCILFPCCCQALAITVQSMTKAEMKMGQQHAQKRARSKKHLLLEIQYLTTSPECYNNECMRSSIMTVADPAWYRLKLCFCNDFKDRSFHFCCHDQLIFQHMHFLLSLWQCLMFSTPFHLEVGGWPCADNCRANGDEGSTLQQ